MSDWAKKWKTGRVTKWGSKFLSEDKWMYQEWSLKKLTWPNGPPHEYWDELGAVGETRHSALQPFALHQSASLPPTWSPRLTTAGSSWQPQQWRRLGWWCVWDTGTAEVPTRLPGGKKQQQQTTMTVLFWELLHKDVCYFWPEKVSLHCVFSSSMTISQNTTAWRRWRVFSHRSVEHPSFRLSCVLMKPWGASHTEDCCYTMNHGRQNNIYERVKYFQKLATCIIDFWRSAPTDRKLFFVSNQATDYNSL